MQIWLLVQFQYPEMHNATATKGPTRLLAFALEGKQVMPEVEITAHTLPGQPKSEASPDIVATGAALYSGYCKICHGSKAVARFSGSVPDLRYATTATFETWDAIVVGGSKAAVGMPGMEISIEQSQAIRAYVLNLAEELLAGDRHIILDTAALTHAVQQRAVIYDKSQDGHFNLISALHKSLRGSDPDAALYWLARMFAGGEDPLYVARRLVRFASEDIGLADPQALVQSLSAWQAYERLGSPEGELAIAQSVIYLASAPKSNAVYLAFGSAGRSARDTGSLLAPKHILNAPTALMQDLDYGTGYAYDHDTEEGFSGQDYFPEGMTRQKYYEPSERGFENEISKRLAYWNKLRSSSTEEEV